MEDEIITRDNYPDIYKWLSENVYNHTRYSNHFTLTSEGKINAYGDVDLDYRIREIKHPFGYVKGSFSCSNCVKLTSLKGSPYKLDGIFEFRNCDSLKSIIGFPKIIKGNIRFFPNRFTNISLLYNSYNLYIDMWFELLNSVSDDIKIEYFNNYKDKVDYTHASPIIPKEIINKYKINFLLKND